MNIPKTKPKIALYVITGWVMIMLSKYFPNPIITFVYDIFFCIGWYQFIDFIWDEFL